MREFSKLAPVSASRKSVSVFGGYNHTEQCADGEWYEEKNLCTDAYPAMAVEKKRGIMAGSPTFLRGAVAAVGKDYPVAICESTTQGKGHLVCGSHRLENVIDLSEAMRPKQMVSTGAFCVIWPDKYFVNARKLYDGESMVAGQDYGSLGYSFQVTSAQMGENVLKANQCLTDGTVISPARSSTAPSDAQDGDYWMDTGAETRTLYRYSANSASWAAVSSPYVRISYPHIVKDADGTVNLCAGDAIRVLLANFDTLYLDGVYYIEKACSSTDADAMGEQTDYIVLRGAMIGDDIDSGQAESGSAAYTLKLAREIPDLDYVVECENRLWGCRYGVQSVSGQFVNEIYASALGDFRNWNRYLGISTDSYTASRGADGKYTGAAVLDSHPLFFRENGVEKVFPSSSGAHQITWQSLEGIQDGSWASAKVIDNVLYYKGVQGVYAYSGGLPTMVSAALGAQKYTNAVAARMEKKYYISMQDTEGSWTLFCYDTQYRQWHRQDSTRFYFAANWNHRLFYRASEAPQVESIGDTADSDGVLWYAQTGKLGLYEQDHQFVSRILLKLRLDPGARIKILIRYDGGSWICKREISANRLRTSAVVIVPRRCEFAEIRLEGVGGCVLYRLAYSVEKGSDDYVF